MEVNYRVVGAWLLAMTNYEARRNYVSPRARALLKLEPERVPVLVFNRRTMSGPECRCAVEFIERGPRGGAKVD